MGINRKLKDISQAMNSMTTPDNLANFLKNPEDAQGLNGLVEDIRCALMDYRVCTLKQLALIVSNIHFRLHYNETSMMKTVRL